MLDSGLLISWGEIYPGREEHALLRLFSEVVAYGGKLVEEGRISGFEPFVVRARGGDLRDLRGFMIIRGTREQMTTLRHDDAFLAYVERAKKLMNRVGVDELYLGEELRHILEPFESRVARSRSPA